jgi:YVTN family beta-propeller protein
MNTYQLVRCVLAAGRGGAWKKLALALMLACLFVPASSRAQNAYVANETTVSVIDTATDAVIATIPVGLLPNGISIQPSSRFAGVPGSNNCHGTSVSALAIKFGDLDVAAAALGFTTVLGLQDAIQAFVWDSGSRLSRRRGTG